jgi:hypothetical protein
VHPFRSVIAAVALLGGCFLSHGPSDVDAAPIPASLVGRWVADYCSGAYRLDLVTLCGTGRAWISHIGDGESSELERAIVAVDPRAVRLVPITSANAAEDITLRLDPTDSDQMIWEERVGFVGWCEDRLVRATALPYPLMIDWPDHPCD